MNLQTKTKDIYFFTKFELLKMLRQGRLYTGLAIVIMFIFLCTVGAQARLYRLEKRGRTQLHKRNIVEVVNTVSYSLHCLPPAMDVLFPILAGIFCASIFAGEFENKRIRTMAMRPISRTHLFMGKFFAMSAYILLFYLLLWLLSLLTGAAMFNHTSDAYLWGKPFLCPKHNYIIPESIMWKKYVLTFLCAPIALIGYTSIFMVFSVIFKRFTSAASIPVGIYFVSLALEQMPIFSPIRTYLPSYYFACWKYIVHPTVPWKLFSHNAIILVIFSILSLIAGTYIFKSADI